MADEEAFRRKLKGMQNELKAWRAKNLKIESQLAELGAEPRAEARQETENLT